MLFSVGIWESFLHLPGTLGLGWSTRKHRVAAVENRTPLKSGDLVSKPGLAMKSILLFSQSQASTRCQHMFAPFWVFECELCKTIVYEYSMLKYMELLCGWIIISAGSLPLGSAGGRAAGRTTSWEKCDEHIAKQLLCVVPPRYLSWLIRVQYCGFLGDIISIVFMGLSIYNWGGELHQNSVVFPWIPMPVLPANHWWQLEKNNHPACQVWFSKFRQNPSTAPPCVIY